LELKPDGQAHTFADRTPREYVVNMNRNQAASIRWLLLESYYKLSGNATTSVNEKAKIQFGLATSFAGRE
jgi:hypothetical protein